MFDDALSVSCRTVLAGFDHRLRSMKFYLAGNAGLALQLGHRRVKELQFFTAQVFEPDFLSRQMKSRTGYRETLQSPGIVTGTLKRVKLSFQYNLVHLRHPLLEYRNVIVADWRDIFADVFKALAEEPRRMVFYDLYACLTLRNLDIPAAVATFRRRYGREGIDDDRLLRNLDDFTVADRDPKPDLLKPLAWQTVRDFFRKNQPKFERYLVAGEGK